MGLIIFLLVVGTAAGFIATRMMDLELDLVSTVAIGVLGAVIGGVLLRFLAFAAGWLGGFVGAVLGAVLLIWVWKRYGPKR